jgi:hypothetical protein
VLSKEERVIRYGRIRPTGLLQRPAWAPFLQGIEPYRALLNGIRDVAVHEDAICPVTRLPRSGGADQPSMLTKGKSIL